nr:hypothetical protein [uncultured bacterium]
MAKSTATPIPTPTVMLQPVSANDLSVTGIKSNPVLLRQVVLAYLANQRQANAHTKKRGEVSGGGRKPWKQKGTGRARVGSSRTPLWRGGGVIFGPNNLRNYDQILTIRTRRQALGAALQAQAQAGNIKSIILPDGLVKTKDVKQQLPELYGLRDVLLVLPDDKLKRVFRNLSNVHIASVAQLTAWDILAAHTIVLADNTAEQFKSRIK